MRRLLQLALPALVAVAPLSGRATDAAEVVAVQSNRVADLVLLGTGHNAGLREGMVCRLTRRGAEVAEILLVEVRPTAGSALIVSLAAGQSIRPGDTASIKILKV